MISNIDIFKGSDLKAHVPKVCTMKTVDIDQLNAMREKSGISKVDLGPAESMIEYIVNLSRFDKQKANEFLLQNVHSNNGNRSSSTIYFLKRIRDSENLAKFQEEDLMALFLVLADASDSMSEIYGPVAFEETNIFFICVSLAEKLFSILNEGNRISVVSKAIKEGNAKSWLMYFVLGLMWIGRMAIETLQSKGRWLSKDELELYKGLAKERLHKVLKAGYHRTSNPYFLFHFWWQTSTNDELLDIKEWVTQSTNTDLEFLRFIDVFSKKQMDIKGYTRRKVYWWVIYRMLGKFTNLEEAKDRLKKIVKGDGELSDVAMDLLNRIVSAETFTKEREAGLHRPTLIRG